MSNYFKPSVSSDVVVFNIHAAKFRDDGAFVNIVLIKRSPNSKAFPGSWALPGGFLSDGETVEACAARELKEETGINAKMLIPIGVYSEPHRDPRGPVISNAFSAVIPTCDPNHLEIKAGDDASDCCLFNLKGHISEKDNSVDVSLRCIENGVRIAYKAIFKHGPFGILHAEIVEDKSSNATLAFDHAEIIARAITKMPAVVIPTALKSPVGTDTPTSEKK